MPAIVCRAVGKYAEDDLRSWLRDQDPAQALSVFVGASSREKAAATSLARAYELRTEVRPDLPLGGVAIPERHARRGDEHLRLIAKQAAGCSFFVTQVVYDINVAKNLVSDYRYECAAQDLDPVPIVFTFSVCGSMKTLEFLRWLGVDVPRWIENDLRHADDTLEASYDQAVATALELISFCRRVRVPYGLNVESVSIRKVEIESSVRGEYGAPKTRRSVRAIPLAARLVAELEDHHRRTVWNTDEDLVLAHPHTGRPLDRVRLLQHFKAALRRANVRPVRIHDLRHTFATTVAASGEVSLRTLQEWMGHLDARTTQIYADYQPGEREAELVDRAFSGGQLVANSAYTPQHEAPANPINNA